MSTHSVAKIVEIVGTSEKSWTDAADNGVKRASKTIKNITGVQIQQMTASVKKGKIVRYKATLKIAFGLEDD